VADHQGGWHQKRVTQRRYSKSRSANSGRSPARDDRNVRFAVAIG
jgi:hypothetical protein